MGKFYLGERSERNVFFLDNERKNIGYIANIC